MSAPPKARLTWRSILLGLLLIPPNCYWIVQMERVRKGPYVTSISLFANALFVLVLLALVNAAIARRYPKRALSPAELLVTYSMVALASGLCGMDFVQVLMQIIGYAAFFARPENAWADLILPHLPKWLTVQDTEALKGYYSGYSSLYQWSNLRAWMVPALAWTGFAAVLLWIMLCMNVVFRQQWMARERLTFPIVVLPLELVTPGLPLFRNRLMWAGFVPAFVISLLNGLALFYPSLPHLNVGQYDFLQRILRTKPWYAVGWTPVTFYPFCIGLCFLLPVDLLFSCWFFYFYWKAQKVISNAMAWDATPRFPFIDQQVFGALIGLAIALLWTSRGYLREVWLAAQGKPSEVSNSQDAVSYRSALISIGIGVVLLVLFCRLAGMSWGIAIGFMLLYLLISFVVTRIRAELGPPVHDFHGVSPDLMIPSALGTVGARPQDLSMISLLYWFNRAYRSHPMPVQMEGLKMAQMTSLDSRGMVKALVLAGIVGMVASIWAFLHLGYSLGTAGKFWSGYSYGTQIFGRLQSQITAPVPPQMMERWAMLFGLVCCTGLSAMRVRYLWWPFHPIGYTISGSWSMNLVWMPMLIAWVLKGSILKWGGLRLYRTLLPFFLGLILGDIMMGCLWSLIGIALGVETYSFWGA
ncbi:MAG TPA: hypothetical protein PLZ94_00225 [Armatimonadota bacterium]|nr:hypothetical protein [Armatimonadota bacterium]HPO71604.1 hypothetical protein [Armatimonadota bacterium]